MTSQPYFLGAAVPCQGPVVLPPGYMQDGAPAPLSIPAYGPSSPIVGAVVPPGGRPPTPGPGTPATVPPGTYGNTTKVAVSPKTDQSLFIVGLLASAGIGLWFFRDQLFKTGQ